ncbi:MAG: O-antigen ligase family protein [Sphingobacteriaceae bacterium]|nr:O-antigen ligase family protein [Sphingobacteriaceae bacterium]
MNATYVNITIFGTEKVLRVNGFLFHGIELAVIIFFFFVNIALFRKTSNVYILFVVMVALEFMTKIKSGIMTSILYLGFFTYLIDEKYRFIKASVFAAVIILSISFIYILIPDIETNRLNFDFRHFKFEGQLFTGRGFIWNVYITSLKTIDTWQVLFGCGYGSAPDMFRQGATNTMAAVSKIAPGPHNQLLELFVNGGLFAMWFIFYILKKQYSKLKKLFNNKVVLKYYLAVILIPIVIMGLTAPIMSMFIYWCGLSMFVISLKLKFSEENA